MATCPHADRVIPLLHDNELQNPLRREMVTHMAACVTCARTFSLLEREQELFTQAIEERVDSIDFSSFWQAVEGQLSESSLSWRTRLRLWYESWQPAWDFPVPAWAVAALLLFLVPTHLALNNDINNPPSPSAKNAPSIAPPKTLVDTSPHGSPTPPMTDITQAPRETPHETTPLDPHSIQRAGLNDNQAQQDDDQARIDSLYTYGSGTIAIHILHDSESNSTVISYGDGASE